MKRLQGKLQRSKLVHLNSSLSRLTTASTYMPLADTATLSAQVSHESEVCEANQLILTSPVADKSSAHRPIRTKSTDSITDWANRAAVLRFLPILNTDAWENTKISRYSQTMSLTNSYLWVLWHFFNNTQKKLLIFTPKLPTAALSAKYCSSISISNFLF